jgi:pilus assembly protein CpaE
MEAAAGDRRMQKAHVKVQMGGAPAALEAYRSAPTPNVVVLESHGERTAILGTRHPGRRLRRGTKVVVIGHVNDVILYRELMRRGVSDYVIAPAEPLAIVRAMSELFTQPGADPSGAPPLRRRQGRRRRVHGRPQRRLGRRAPVVRRARRSRHRLGTAGLDFNQDPPRRRGGDLRARPLDANLVDRLLSKCSDT